MKRIITSLLVLLAFITSSTAQKVGLVLSGGGAKGIAHIGMIKAFEEHNIPIDYITGTSMGAIVGGLYATGYTPEEMLALIKSEAFQTWMTGEVEEQYLYYFKQDDPTPEFLNIKLSGKDSTEVNKNFILPTNLINPRQMNIVFSQLFAQASAACKYNFDNLIIPFRCVSSDVYNRVPFISKDGDLGDAIRASMSFPFVFKPIKINGTLLYDGGIFDNFPVSTMISDFNPDFIVGSQVSSGRIDADERDIVGQVENMIMDKTEYAVPEDRGILLRFNLDYIGLLDFQKADEVYQIGYDVTMRYLDSIKHDVARRVPEENIALKRAIFRSKLPDLEFKHVILDGVNGAQRDYIRSQLLDNQSRFSFDEFKELYFKLLSESKISEIIPHCIYNEKENCFDLHLTIKLDKSIALSLGGLISFQNFNEVYVGLAYRSLTRLSQTYKLDAQMGKAYNSVRVRARTDIPYFRIPMSLNIIGALNSNRYYEGEKFFDQRESTAFISTMDYYGKFKLGFPFMNKGKAEIGIGGGRKIDRYFQPLTTDTRNFDRSKFNMGAASFMVDRNSLNDKQYATKGFRASILSQIAWGSEHFYGNSPATTAATGYKAHQAFLQLQANYDRYTRIGSHFIWGHSLELMLSSRNFMNNYTVTMIEAPGFTPTPHSKMIFNEAFRAFQYVAGGIKPIWAFNDNFHIRSEVYAFLPYREILSNSLNQPYFGSQFNKVKFLGELSGIFKFGNISLSAYVNYYSHPVSSWNVGFNIGTLIFTPKLIE